MTHLAAFHCAKCPRNNNPQVGPSCPAWWETVHQNVQSGETKVIKSCAWEQLPIYLIEVVKASNRPAAAVESTRNEIVNGFERLTRSVQATRLFPQSHTVELQPSRAEALVSGSHSEPPDDGRGE